jgi:hypothetical protein
MRVSDADRERVAERLREHFAAGRLTSEELDERVEAALGAKTTGELRAVLADLPEPTPASPQAGQVPPRWSGRPMYGYRRGPRLLPLALIVLFAVLLLHGAVGFFFFALFKIVLVLFLVAAIAGFFTVARFRRRARRFWRSNWQSGPHGHWHHDDHDEWHHQ